MLDFEEFINATRKDLDISSDQISDPDIQKIFASVDLDGSGEISAEEFVEWLGQYSACLNSAGWFEQLVAGFIAAAKAKVRRLNIRFMSA